MSLSRIDQAITVVNWVLDKKKDEIKKVLSKVEISPKERLVVTDYEQLIKNVEILIREAKKDVNMHLGKLPPQAVDLEYMVLGAAILEKPAYEAVKGFLLAEHFYTPVHQMIYTALGNIRSHDMHTLVIELRRTGHIEMVGGAYYIAELTARVSQTANIQLHAAILIEMAIKRQLIIAAGVIVQTGYDDSTDCFDLLETTENEINKVKSWIKNPTKK